MYDIMLSTSNILFNYSALPAVTILLVYLLNFRTLFLCAFASVKNHTTLIASGFG